MKRKLLALTLSTFSLALSSCGDKPNVVTRNVLQENPEWFDCEKVDKENRPTLPKGYVIDWSGVTSVEEARAEHEAHVAAQLKRNGVVAGYLVMVEDIAFTCWNNMETQRKFYAQLPD